jgi:hypothetical protein
MTHGITRESNEELRHLTIPHGKTWPIQGRAYYGRKIFVRLECDGRNEDGRKCGGQSAEKIVDCPQGCTANYGSHIDIHAVCEECGAHLWAIVQFYQILSVVSIDAEEEIVRSDENAYNKALDVWNRRNLFRRAWDWFWAKNFVPPSRLWHEKNAFSSRGMNGLYYVVSIRCPVEGCFGSTHPIAVDADQDALIYEAGVCDICGRTNHTWLRIERHRA